jgi:dihydroorotate dehydrogenase
MFYKWCVRPVFFLFSPERSHYMAMRALAIMIRIPLLNKMFSPPIHRGAVTLFGLHFKNRIGLAAGFDKDARWTTEMHALGFAFMEVGTITPRPQQGNPRPRLFRLKKDHALINRMGFNNAGVEAAKKRLKARSTNILVGGNIGKNKDTAIEHAESDYLHCFQTLYDVVDFFVVNVSSPNTPGLRTLQSREPLTALLNSLQKVNHSMPKRKPILLKIAPDLSESELDDIIEIVSLTQIDGVVATNTTLSRDGLQTNSLLIEQIGAGGLSGRPLRERSTRVIRYLKTKSSDAFPIIASGGIHSLQDAQEKIDAGADLVQLYTGFIYEGPGLVRKIAAGVVAKSSIL